MGVKNINILFNIYKNTQSDNPKAMYAAIVDGNNLLITYLQSAIKNLNYGIDIIKQTENIISAVYERIINEFDKFTKIYKLNEIWVVFDPRHNTEYNIDVDLFDLIDVEYFKNKYKDDKFVLLSKDIEHIKREKSRLYSEKQFTNPIEKELYGFQNQRIANKLIKMLQKTLVNASRFTNGCNWLSEEYDYLTNKYKMREQYKLYVVQGEHTEADLLIKNIVEMLNILHPNEQFLVISRDTDYKILLSNRSNVWCADINYYKTDIINPYLTWLNFFKPLIEINNDKHNIEPSEIYNMVIRIAPLIGNDYTAGYSNIITFRSNDKYLNLPILKLFNKNINVNINHRTNLGKLLARYDYNLSLDENIKLYDSKLYGAYIESVVIYHNWISFGNDYEINTKHINFDENLKLIYKIILLPEFEQSIKAKTEDEFVKMFYNTNNEISNEFDDYFNAMEEDTIDNKQSNDNDNNINGKISNEYDDYFNTMVET